VHSSARLGAQFGIEVKSRPRLDHGVDVKRADFAAKLHEIERRGIDRDIDAETLPAAGGQQGREQLAVIGFGDPSWTKRIPMSSMRVLSSGSTTTKRFLS